MTKWTVNFQSARYDSFFPFFLITCILTGALLDTVYIDCLLGTFRRGTNDDNGSFCTYSPFWKVFLEWRLALRKTLGSILFKSIQSFSLFILLFMYCVQMIIYLRFCHFRSWWILKVHPCRYQPPVLKENHYDYVNKWSFDTSNRTPAQILRPLAADITNLHWDPRVLCSEPSLQVQEQAAQRDEVRIGRPGAEPNWEDSEDERRTILEAIQVETETWTDMPFFG